MRRKCLVVMILSLVLCMLATVAFGESWSCPECSQSNSGNFCSNCGAKKPESTTYTQFSPGEYTLVPNCLSNMRFDYQNNGDVLVSWADSGNNGPYKVTYTIDGWQWKYHDEDNYRSCRALLEYLIPGETFTVTVEDKNGNEISENYTVPRPIFTEFKTGGKYLNMTQTSFSLREMDRNPTETFELKVSWPMLKKSRSYKYKLVLKSPMGYTSRVWAYDGFEFQNRWSYRYWTIALKSEWLDRFVNDYDEIPIGKYTFEIYMDGQLYDYKDFQVSY